MTVLLEGHERRAYSARLVAISPETPDASLSTSEKAELTYPVLSDTGARLADTLGITFDPSEDGLAAQRTLGVDIRTTREDDGTRLPMPTVLIVDPEHTVRFVDIHPDYTGRTEVNEILAAPPNHPEQLTRERPRNCRGASTAPPHQAHARAAGGARASRPGSVS